MTSISCVSQRKESVQVTCSPIQLGSTLSTKQGRSREFLVGGLERGIQTVIHKTQNSFEFSSVDKHRNISRLVCKF